MKHSNTALLNAPPGLPDLEKTTSRLPFNPVFNNELNEGLFAKTADTGARCAEIRRRYTTPLVLAPGLCRALNK
jgi:hypothetical protein